jgi:predicted lysophospholipase L1 biosynthesis ABC-type transport system permease subunit
MARTYWPGGSPLGARIRIGPSAPFTVVGVVGEVLERGYERTLKPGAYFSFAQFLDTWAEPQYLLVRTAGAPEEVVAPIRRIVAAVDADQPIARFETMETIVGLELTDRHQQLTLLGVFAGLALLLASIGLYGVLSYAVAQRSREIALRIALGATKGSVLRMVLGRGIALTAIGLAAGAAIAWTAARTMASVLRGVSGSDPATYAAVVLLLGAIGVAASYLPARRAARLDPSEVLRAE